MNNSENQERKEQICLKNVKEKLSMDSCYGFSNKEFRSLKTWLSQARANKYKNDFPDFLFEDGFIEHFSVTSSKENKKGSSQKAKSAILKRNSENVFLNKLNENPEDIIVTSSCAQSLEKHSHINIIDSIKRNWKKHILSLKKDSTTYKYGVFLIEYSDIGLETAISRNHQPVEIFESYKISVDQDLLQWIYNNKETIDYLILSTPFYIEVIKLDQILNITQEIPTAWFAPVIGLESHKYIGGKLSRFN